MISGTTPPCRKSFGSAEAKPPAISDRLVPCVASNRTNFGVRYRRRIPITSR